MIGQSTARMNIHTHGALANRLETARFVRYPWDKMIEIVIGIAFGIILIVWQQSAINKRMQAVRAEDRKEERRRTLAMSKAAYEAGYNVTGWPVPMSNEPAIGDTKKIHATKEAQYD